ncbi:MAG: DUF4139 domain-containing protein [Desulfovibrionales bacterium]|nr:DUF4139 domain-containing protein [Desulfovibrionales bacterium]
MARILLVLILCMPLSAWAAPVRVTLFPASAQVEEATVVTPTPSGEGFSSVLLTLPGQADPATLRFGEPAGQASIADVSWSVRQEPNLSALGPLNARLAELKNSRVAVAAELEGIRGRVAFWKAQTQTTDRTMAGLRELAAELETTLRHDTATVLTLEQRLAEVDRDIARVEEEIARTAGQQRTVWDVRVLLSGSAPKELAYAYTLGDCGWTPLYRLEARPGQNVIEFSWQAKVWQRSGLDWNAVGLHLATMQPDVQAGPADMPPWEIRPRQAFPRAMAAPAMLEMKADSAAAQAPSQPREVRHATYAAWDMGNRSLPAGQTRIFRIADETWAASFVHLLRPSLDSKAFVQASTTFPQPKELPLGTGLFLMDGAVVDQRDFALSGREGTLFFGPDPLLTCATTLRDKKTGEKGLLKQKQTFLREWTMTVRNASTHPAQVRVEEPRPLARDERIVLEFKAEPQALEENDAEILAWNSTVPPGAEKAFRVLVRFEAPEDLHVDPGWRW